MPMERLLAANAAVQRKITLREPGMTANSPMVDGKAIPAHPWDPQGPALSVDIPLLIGYARTEETLYDRPTPETLALDEAGLRERASKRLGGDPSRVIDAFRKAYPEATPWDLWILIATDHPRGTYSRELAKRKADQRVRRRLRIATTGKHLKAADTCDRRTPSRFSSCSTTSRSPDR